MKNAMKAYLFTVFRGLLIMSAKKILKVFYYIEAYLQVIFGLSFESYQIK
jgi:hypothetical protein